MSKQTELDILASLERENEFFQSVTVEDARD